MKKKNNKYKIELVIEDLLTGQRDDDGDRLGYTREELAELIKDFLTYNLIEVKEITIKTHEN